MTDIASRSGGVTTDLVYDLHHIARSVLHQIGEEHRITDYDQDAFTSHGPSFGPMVSSTPVRMQPIQGRGSRRVDRRGHGRDGGRGRGRDGEGGRGTSEPTLLTSIPSYTYPSPDTSILPHTYPSLDISILPHTYPSPYTFIPPQTYISPSIPLYTYT